MEKVVTHQHRILSNAIYNSPAFVELGFAVHLFLHVI